LLRAGVPASDLAAWAAEAVRATLRRPHRFRPLRAYLTGIDGDQELGPLVGFLGEGWPGDDLWICATRRVDGRRVVYGRPGAPPVPLSTAVAASSAVPGYFRAVAHGGDEYVDGGVISATNADVLRTRDLDLVVVVAPMSTRAMPRVGVAGAIRIFVRRQLTAELARLEAEGIETLVIEPGPRVLRHIGTDFMATDALTDIVRDAFFDTGRLLAGAGERAARLASRHAARGMQHRHAAEAIGPPDLPRRRCRVP
jgi:NTE family protein